MRRASPHRADLNAKVTRDFGKVLATDYSVRNFRFSRSERKCLLQRLSWRFRTDFGVERNHQQCRRTRSGLSVFLKAKNADKKRPLTNPL